MWCLKRGNVLEIDGVRIKVLSPSGDSQSMAMSDNNQSLVLQVCFGGRSFLFTGDIEKSTEALLVASGEALRADVLKVVDKVIGAIQEHGITDDELKQAKVNFRSSFLESLETGGGFGRADLLAALALYDDEPNRINTILGELEKITAADVQLAAKKWLSPSNRTSIDRRPEGGEK